MKSIREVVSENLVALRKQNNYTQLELSKRLNYTDKAISRWENGEVLPDLETLQSIADVYEVPLSYIIEERTEQKTKEADVRFNRTVAVELLTILAIWTIITVTYFAILTFNETNYWQIFVWGVPVSTIVAQWFNARFYHRRALYIIFTSVICWSIITAIYLELIEYNLWMMFVVGAPVQACLIVLTFLKFNK